MLLDGFGCWGLDHSHADLETLEKMVFNQEAVADFWNQYMITSPIQEMVILSTCNRVECYFYAQDAASASEAMAQALSQFKRLPLSFIHQNLVCKTGKQSIEHLFRVVSGVESMVFGENEILAQVKDALSMCHKLNTTGALLNKVFQCAVATGKRVRKETLISKGAYSISSIAVDAFREHLSPFEKSPILIVGAGTMALRAIKKLHALCHEDLTICNRSDDKLVRLAGKYGLRILPFNQLSAKAKDYTAILLATSSETYLLLPEYFDNTSKTTVIVDLSVPRNASPDIACDTIAILSVEHLKAIVQRTMASRKKELAHILSILDEDYSDFLKWLRFKQTL